MEKVPNAPEINKNKELKYIIVMTPKGERAILFSTDLVHCTIYKSSEVISAGLVSITPYGIVHDVYGDAQSFKSTKVNNTIFPRPEDRYIINQTLHFGPWDYNLSSEDIEKIPGLKEVFNQ